MCLRMHGAARAQRIRKREVAARQIDSIIFTIIIINFIIIIIIIQWL